MQVRILAAALLAVPTVTATLNEVYAFEDDSRPIALAPTSPWAADFAEDSCALRRRFGEKETAVFLEITQYAPGRTFVVTVAGKSLETTRELVNYWFLPVAVPSVPPTSTVAQFSEGFRGVMFSARLREETGNIPDSVDAEPLASPPGWLPPNVHARPAIVDVDDKGQSVATELEVQISDADYQARAQKITALRIEKAFKQPITLNTGPMLEPMRVMDDCMQNLLQAWGLKPGPDGKMPTMAEPTNAEMWAEAILEDYPVDAMRNEISDTLRLRIMVDADGRAESCKTQTPARRKSLEKAACRPILRLAKFKPVLDSAGTPVPSYYVTTVSYSIN